MKVKVSLLILSLLIMVSISSFFWLNSLVSAVENGHASQAQLKHISQLGIKSRLYLRLKAFSPDDNKWQAIAKVLAKTDGAIAFDLGKYYLENSLFRQAKLWFLQGFELKRTYS